MSSTSIRVKRAWNKVNAQSQSIKETLIKTFKSQCMKVWIVVQRSTPSHRNSNCYIGAGIYSKSMPLKETMTKPTLDLYKSKSKLVVSAEGKTSTSHFQLSDPYIGKNIEDTDRRTGLAIKMP